MTPDRRWLWLAVAVHCLFGTVYLAILPLWGAVPDEPLHYSRIKYEAEFHRWPRITDPRPWGEPLAVYCLTADPAGASQHGPLYYTPAVPLYWLTSGLSLKAQLYALRGWSLVLGAIMVWLAWLALRELFDDGRLVAAGTMLVALLPHRLLMSAVIYNDIACGAATTLYLLWLIRAVEPKRAGAVGAHSEPQDARPEPPAGGPPVPPTGCGTALADKPPVAPFTDASPETAPMAAGDFSRRWLLAGCGLGLAYLAKRVVLVTVPGSLVLLWLWHRRSGRPRDDLARAVGAWLLGFLLVGGWWIALDARRYGELLPMEPGLGRATWPELFAALPAGEIARLTGFALRGLWLSIWSQVGWVPFDAGAGWAVVAWLLYGAFALATVAVPIGLARGWRREPGPARDLQLGFLVMLAGMVYGALHWVLLSGFHGNEETGKHAIALIVPLVALAAWAWRALLGERRAAGALWLGAGLFLFFNLASLTRLTTYLIPTHAPPDPPQAVARVRDLPSGAAPGLWHRYRVPGVVQQGGYVAPPGPPPAELLPPE